MKRRSKRINICKFKYYMVHDFWSNCEAVKVLVGRYIDGVPNPLAHHKWQEHGVRDKKCFTVDLF